MTNLISRFLRYVSFDTQSSESSQTLPSTPGQRVLAEAIADELKTLGATDVHVSQGFPLIQLLQLPVGIAFGLMIDVALKLIEPIAVVNYGAAVAYCLLGILLVGVGVWLEFVANVVMLVDEGGGSRA